MADQDKQKRRSPLSWRPPADRWDDFDALVAKSGLGRNAYITECIFGRNRIRPAEIKLLARLLGNGQRLTDALKPFNIAAARDPEIKAKLDEIRMVLIEIRSALFVLMGRKP